MNSLKISKKTLLYIGIGVYIIIVISMGYVMYQQFGEKSAVDKELSTTEVNLQRTNPEKLITQKQELENKLEQLTTDTDTLKAMMSQDIANVDAASIVFDTARSNNVEVTELTSANTTDTMMENVPCNVILLNATVEGNVSDLVNFITRLNSSFSTGIIQPVEISVPQGDSGGNPAVSFTLSIYNYRGD